MVKPDSAGARPLSEKHAEARKALPDELLEPFDALVNDYQFYASVHYGSRLVSYLILADLVRAGWRPSAERSPADAGLHPEHGKAQ